MTALDPAHVDQAHSQGSESGCSAPCANMSAQLVICAMSNKTCRSAQRYEPATPYRIHLLRLLNHCGWKHLIFKNVYVYAGCFVRRYGPHFIITMLTFGPDKDAFYAYAYIIASG